MIPSVTSPLFLLFSTMLGGSPGIVSVSAAPGVPLPALPGRGAAEITAEALRAHVEFLASDELEGRGLGSEGLAKAEAYLAKELEASGLEPAGEDGTFLQAVPIVRPVYDALPELRLQEGDAEPLDLEYGAEFRLYMPGVAGTYDLLLLGEDSALPERVPASTLLCFPDMTRGKAMRWLKEQGHPRAEGLGGVLTFLSRPGKPTDKVPRSGRPRLQTGPPTPGPLWIELTPELRDPVADGLIESVEVNPHHRLEDLLTHNVIARLPSKANGKRPELAEQAIVVSAHFDHIGRKSGPGQPGPDGAAPDLINNGADDDASGVATVLEIARALAAEGPQEREVIFLLATAEEIGIVGTKHYLDQPSTPLESTVANLNFEMTGRPDPKAGGPGRLWLSGAERTNLMEAFLANDFMIVEDPYPDMNFFMRSDNIEFCYRGIVGQTFSSYNLHKDYHQVTDEARFIDFDHMQSCAVAGLQAVRLVADGTIDPEWLPEGMPKPRGR